MSIYKAQKSTEVILKKVIGEGSSSVVYQAEQASFDGRISKKMAVKWFKEGEGLDNFDKELQSLMEIRSPYCVSFYGWEVLENRPALYMKWVDGYSLRAVSRYCRLSSQQADYILYQIFRGIQDLWAQNVVHGDLSPNNILIDIKGKVWLVDFALSKNPERREGTLQYISEKRRQGGMCSPDDDLFSLSMIAKELEGQSLRLQGNEDLPFWWDSLNQKDLEDLKKEAEGLGQIVERMQRAQEQIVKTETISAAPVRSRSLQVLFWCLALVSSTLISSASPLNADYGSSLIVRTRHWIAFSLNGGPEHYSPEAIKSLRPGTYSIMWRSERASGSKQIQLKAGDRTLLNDRDFELQ